MKPEILKFDFKQQLENNNTLDLYIYSEVAPDGYDWWEGRVIESDTSAKYFREKLSEYSNVGNINLYINSCGGSVIEGYGIYAQLKRHSATITVYIDGFANSIASIIAMAADKIIMRINSVMGIHNMMNYCFGNAFEHRKCADDLDRMMEGNREIYMQRSNGKITIEKLTELLDNETILTAQECLEYGFCDEIAGENTNTEDVSKTIQKLNMGIASQIKYFQVLKQSFDAAMQIINEEPKKKVEEPKEPEPKQNNLKTFLAGFKTC